MVSHPPMRRVSRPVVGGIPDEDVGAVVGVASDHAGGERA